MTDQPDDALCLRCGEPAEWVEVRQFGWTEPVRRFRRPCCPVPPTADQLRRREEDEWLRRHRRLAQVTP